MDGPTTTGNPGNLPLPLARALGARRSARLRRVMRHTDLPPEALLDLAIELLAVVSEKLSPAPIRRTAMGLGAARWRNVGAKERSEILRRTVQARWAKHRALAAVSDNHRP